MTRSLVILAVAISMLTGFGRCVSAQSTELHEQPGRVQFHFSGTPWRAVIEWLADSGGYALHVNDLPPGSFTYSDQKFYSHDEAINRINMFLIPQRYTLVRSERLLSVISLVDETSLRQLDSMARTVEVDQLRDLDSHELVRCLFPLGEIASEQAIEELRGLMLIREPSVLEHSNQLLVMDTASKLRSVQRILASMSQPDVSFGPVKRFALGSLDAEKTLVQIRPHVGLDPLAMIGADIRLSIDKDRHQLLASGSTENLQAIANVIALLQESDGMVAAPDQLIFRPHDLKQADMQTVVNILQTLLADEDVRMAPDPKSNQLAILAKEEVHQRVDETIANLSGSFDAQQFKIFEVDAIDAGYAAIILHDMFTSSSDPADEDSTPVDAPRIDADGVSGRLFVRARKKQLQQIEEALLQFERPTGPKSPNLRILPYRGPQADSLLESAREFWPYEDRIEIVPSGEHPRRPLEREIESSPDSEPPTQEPSPYDELVSDRPSGPSRQDATQLVGTEPRVADAYTHAASIRVQQTPRGLLVYSDDEEAVGRFEEHLRLLAGSNRTSDRRLAVFYLKHARVEDANALLRQLLVDESLTSTGRPLGLSRFSPTGGTSGLGSLWNYATATVIPDKRLNRLFVYGTDSELGAIEEHLQVIDRENSIADLKTRGTPHVIVLRHAKAEAVAAVIRDAYAGRIASTAKERSAVAAAAAKDRRPQGNNRSDENRSDAEVESRSTAALPPTGDEDKMTLAVDPQGNTIVVTAPSQLAAEVEQLARAIDKESEQTIQVIPVNVARMRDIQESLQNLYQRPSRSRSQP